MTRSWKSLTVAFVACLALLGLDSHNAEAASSTKSTPTAKKKAQSATKQKVPQRKAKTATGTRKPSSKPRQGQGASAGLRSVSNVVQLPALGSAAVLVKDLETGMPLLEKDGDRPRPIASITKLMTAMVVLDAQQPLDEIVEVTDADVDRIKFSSSRLAVGAKLTRRQLLRLALMSSENRAAHALARTYPGGVQAFVKAMNLKAQRLQLYRTRFADPTGLSPRNIASPQDLATMVAAAAAYPTISELSTDAEESLRVARKERLYRNTNPLVKYERWDIAVSKTGYIREAGRCLVMQALINNRQTLIVLLDGKSSATRVRDAQSIKQWLEHVAPVAESSNAHSRPV